MLNRHLLRAKALQYLYALHNAKRSDFILAEDYLDKTFSPNFHNSEELTSEELDTKRKQARKLLQEVVDGKDFPKGTESDIEGHVRKAKKDYLENCRKDTEKLGRLMLDETMAIYDRFLAVVSFLCELGDVCHNRSELKGIVAEEKGGRLDYFYQSFPIQYLRENKVLGNLLQSHRIGWSEHMDFVEEFYKTQFRASDVTKKMLSSSKAPDRVAQIAWVEHVVKELFFANPATDSFFEDQDSNWQENKSIVKAMVYKTLKRIYDSEDGKWEPVAITPDWDEDKRFFENLYRLTCEENDRLELMLEKYLKNWDLERVTVVDVIILKMALTEMIHFPSIPIKVTINEFIELAKRYSTPRSKEFVNGILDRTSKDLKDQGIIKKSGRGLLDNA
jgi:N utilization substance protein B